MWRAFVLCALVGCAKPVGPVMSAESSTPAERLMARIAAHAPAVMGHRGTGKTRPGHPWPENALSSFGAAMEVGAHGIELDVELTADGALVVMHDDTLDRTTDAQGCVSAYPFDSVRSAKLLDGEGVPTTEVAPTLEEVFALVGDAVVNIELKVFEEGCRTPTTDAATLARSVVAEVTRLGVAEQVVLSSFDDEAVRAARAAHPGLYVGLLGDWDRVAEHASYVADALALGMNAIHPSKTMTHEGVAHALAAGLQVNMWTVNGVEAMNRALDQRVTSILTDEPDVLRELLLSR